MKSAIWWPPMCWIKDDKTSTTPIHHLQFIRTYTMTFCDFFITYTVSFVWYAVFSNTFHSIAIRAILWPLFENKLNIKKYIFRYIIYRYYCMTFFYMTCQFSNKLWLFFNIPNYNLFLPFFQIPHNYFCHIFFFFNLLQNIQVFSWCYNMLYHTSGCQSFYNWGPI